MNKTLLKVTIKKYQQLWKEQAMFTEKQATKNLLKLNNKNTTTSR